MLIVGTIDIISGLVAILDDNFLVGAPGKLYVVDTTAWGWITLIIGVIVVGAAFGVFAGMVWARAIGAILAGANAIAQLGIIRAYPIWALIVITIDILVIYGLIVHGGELREER
jgi:hypothetical protein